MYFFHYLSHDGRQISQEFGPFGTREEAGMAASRNAVTTVFRWSTYLGRMVEANRR